MVVHVGMGVTFLSIFVLEKLRVIFFHIHVNDGSFVRLDGLS